MPIKQRIQKSAVPAVRSPLKKAAISSIIYILLCSTYIVISGRLAEALAGTEESLAFLEFMKGIAFIIVTGLIYFAISLARWKRIRLQEETIISQQKALLLGERRAVAGMYAATMAHDLNNLLMSLNGLVMELKDRDKGDEFLIKMREELDRASQNLAVLSKHVASTVKNVIPDEVEDVDLPKMVKRIITLLRTHPDFRNADLHVADTPPIVLRLHPMLLEEAILNLLLNSAQASGDKPRIEVNILSTPDAVLLEVNDNGPGIAPEQFETLFLPCFTTKPNGTGLGLMSVRTFADSCDAEISIDRSEMGGALFRIRIPKNQKASNKPMQAMPDGAPDG